MFSLTTWFFIMFFCIIGLIALNPAIDKVVLINTLDTSFNHSYENITKNLVLNPNETNVSVMVINIIYKCIDTVIYVYLQIARIVGRLAVENPQINFKLIITLVILALLLMVIVPLVKLGVLVYVLIYDWVQTRKYKRLLKELQDEREKNKKS